MNENPSEQVMARVMDTDVPIESVPIGELLPAVSPSPEVIVHKENALGLRQAARADFGGHLIEIHALEDVEKAAIWFLASRLFPDAKTKEQMTMKCLVALELGCFNFHGLRAITVIVDTRSGVPSITVNYSLLASLVNTSGRYSFECVENTEKRCEIKFFDQGRLIGTQTYTIERATRAGLTGKDNWQKNPDQMLYAAAMRNGVKSFCPDLIFCKRFGVNIT